MSSNKAIHESLYNWNGSKNIEKSCSLFYSISKDLNSLIRYLVSHQQIFKSFQHSAECKKLSLLLHSSEQYKTQLHPSQTILGPEILQKEQKCLIQFLCTTQHNASVLHTNSPHKILHFALKCLFSSFTPFNTTLGCSISN